MGSKSKNLHYEANEPSFLRKLKAQYTGPQAGRQEYQAARARKQMFDDTDDDPTYVGEDSNVIISKSDVDKMMQKRDDSQAEQAGCKPEPEADIEDAEGKPTIVGKEEGALKETMAAIGGTSKRRIAQVIGESGSKEDSGPKAPLHKSEKKHMKKAKKIKLSFDDEDGKP